MSKWPPDNQSALIHFYGTPGPEVERQLVPVIPPFRMTYEGRPIKNIMFHKKAAAALAAALKEIWDHYAHDQAKLDALGVSKYAGAYNCRKVRGSATKWSNHAFGAAVDLNAEENGLNAKGNMPKPVIDAFKRQGARWGGDYHGRKDPMHFEFCDNGSASPMADGWRAAKERQPLPPPPDVEPVEDAPEKPGFIATVKDSKIAKMATAVAVGEGGDAISTISDTAGQVAAIKGSADQIGVTDWLMHLVTNPRFLVAVAVVVACGCIVYWRWRDHA